MKILTPIFLIAALFLCAATGKKEENDLTKANLKGKIKEVTECGYIATGEDKEMKKDSLFGERITKYNDRGNVIEKIGYVFDFRVDSAVYRYDDNGNKIVAIRWYRSADDCSDESVVDSAVYRYDNRGNMIEAIYFEAGGSKSSAICKYDDKGNMIKEISYWSGGSVDSTIYKYDDKGNEIEEIWYTAEKWYNRVSKWTFKYNEKGNRIEVIFYEEDNLDAKFTDKHDERGNVIEEIRYEPDSVFHSKKSYKYEYDQQGNWTKKTTFEDDKLTYITKREISYY